MSYRLVISETAQEFLKSVPLKSRRMIGRRIEALGDDPRPVGYEPVEGAPGFFRIRSGDYRVIYTIVDEVLLVTVVCVGLRDKIYMIFKRLVK